MKFPELQNAEKYAGLYVFDFGNDHVAVGYTADEIAVLLESERYKDGKVYRIHRAMPDGTLELAGVSRRMFDQEDGVFFYAASEQRSREGFERLCALAAQSPPPCRMKLQRANVPGAKYPNVSAILFPAECTHDVANWLNAAGFDGGEFVEGGPSQVTTYYEAQPAIVERRQLRPARSGARSAEEVLATTHLAIQRIPA
ncbi:MAG TPA: hypothetical protein VLM89_10475 [Phycisphaerae bacterium]|nr:hypothetical protein [Phycisphaerae bacterium]